MNYSQVLQSAYIYGSIAQAGITKKPLEPDLKATTLTNSLIIDEDTVSSCLFYCNHTLTFKLRRLHSIQILVLTLLKAIT